MVRNWRAIQWRKHLSINLPSNNMDFHAYDSSFDVALEFSDPRDAHIGAVVSNLREDDGL